MKPVAWYDPSNGMVSTDQDSPLFTPLGQVWGLYAKEEAKDEPVQTIPNFDQLQQIVNNLERCLTRDSKHEFLRVWIRDWTEHKLSKHTSAALEVKDEPVAGQPLPCPFCGHVGLNFADGETYRWGVASCGGCGASCGDIRREYPDLGEWHTEAIAEWNRRSPAPQRTWVGLTDDEWNELYDEYVPLKHYARLMEAIEAKLKEKNT